MASLMNRVQTLRWDDHRYYHQCGIIQTLHLVSATSFLLAYAWLFIDPAVSAIIGWCVGMVARQSGHIFFEPRGYDRVNGASDAHKEAIKVGYNMRRKAVLIGVWLALPLLLWLSPLTPRTGGFLHDLGLLWLALGVGGLLFRTVHLCFLRSPAWGLAWALKILSDPFHNVALYWRSPVALLRGERLDPIGPEHAPRSA